MKYPILQITPCSPRLIFCIMIPKQTAFINFYYGLRTWAVSRLTATANTFKGKKLIQGA